MQNPFSTWVIHAMLNASFHYHEDELYCDDMAVAAIAEVCGTPVYLYSLRRVLHNYHALASAFSALDAHIHYSAKANGNLTLLRTLVNAGAGIDCVSGGEIYRAMRAGCAPEKIVFAGVGKTEADLAYAVETGIGWVNIENERECSILNQLAQGAGRQMRIALRCNPDIHASTFSQIATGHGGAKFGMTAETIARLLARQADFPHLRFAGLHVHIGSQLQNTAATLQAVETARALAMPYPELRTLNFGGGIPVPYTPGDELPDASAFAQVLRPVMSGFEVLLEPGRSIIADAGILVATVLYVKEHGGHRFVILDTGMTELMRPALYDAHHEIVPLRRGSRSPVTVDVVGPVCETTDTLAKDRALGELLPGEQVAILTTGAYGFAMANQYNARPRPAEVVVLPDGKTWTLARRRETWADLVAHEE